MSLPPKYLVRFDDICSTMNWQIWNEIELVLVKFDIQPILAVVPDNRDPSLIADRPNHKFWDIVRSWQARNWSIALHGWQHNYSNKNSGIIKLTKKSEFAGLPREEQKGKLQKGLEVFNREGVRADCWVAPSHSFDRTTVELLAELGVQTISDGLWRWPHTDELGMTWVPQQLWGRILPMPAGIWTVCYHHNSWGTDELEIFRRDLQTFASHLSGLDEAVALGKQRQLTWADKLLAWHNLNWSHCVRPALGRTLRSVTSK